MLDSCAGTAKRLKEAAPYSLYFVVSEYMKMKTATPELTSIDEVYILCKATNASRQSEKEGHVANIDPVLVEDFTSRIKKHLNARWWNPEEALDSGKIINRP